MLPAYISSLPEITKYNYMKLILCSILCDIDNDLNVNFLNVKIYTSFAKVVWWGEVHTYIKVYKSLIFLKYF